MPAARARPSRPVLRWSNTDWSLKTLMGAPQVHQLRRSRAPPNALNPSGVDVHAAMTPDVTSVGCPGRTWTACSVWSCDHSLFLHSDATLLQNTRCTCTQPFQRKIKFPTVTFEKETALFTFCLDEFDSVFAPFKSKFCNILKNADLTGNND